MILGFLRRGDMNRMIFWLVSNSIDASRRGALHLLEKEFDLNAGFVKEGSLNDLIQKKMGKLLCQIREVKSSLDDIQRMDNERETKNTVD